MKIKTVINKILRPLGIEVSRPRPQLIQPWNTDRDFLPLMNMIQPRTLVDRERCYVLYQACLHVRGLAGDAAEIGVYKGGTARLLATMLSGRKVDLFDTFSGMPSVDPAKDLHREGDFSSTSLEDVKVFLNGCSNVRLFPGIFPGTAEPVRTSSYALVHVDVDIYRSVLDGCSFFYPRLIKGGVMIFDDYGFLTCPGALQAVDEFFADKPERPCYLPTGQCVVHKI